MKCKHPDCNREASEGNEFCSEGCSWHFNKYFNGKEEWKNQLPKESGTQVPGELQSKLSEENSTEKSTTPILSEESEKKQSSERNIIQIQSSGSDTTRNQNNTITLTKNKKTIEELRTSEETKGALMSTNENTTEPMAKECESRSMIPSAGEILPSVLQQQSLPLAKEESDLMNSVDSCNEHLMALMKGLTHDKRPADIQRVETHIADAAVNIASRMTENFKVKLALIRTVREFK